MVRENSTSCRHHPISLIAQALRERNIAAPVYQPSIATLFGYRRCKSGRIFLSSQLTVLQATMHLHVSFCKRLVYVVSELVILPSPVPTYTEQRYHLHKWQIVDIIFSLIFMISQSPRFPKLEFARLLEHLLWLFFFLLQCLQMLPSTQKFVDMTSFLRA